MTTIRCPLCGRKTTADGATRVARHKRGDDRCCPCPMAGYKLQGEGEELAARELRMRAQRWRGMVEPGHPTADALLARASSDDARADALLARAATHSGDVMYELSRYRADASEPSVIDMTAHRVPPRGPEDYARAAEQLAAFDALLARRREQHPGLH